MSAGGVFLILLLLALAALLVLRARSGGVASGERIGDGLRALQENKARFRVLTRESLAETPDDALVSAVLNNLWAKMDDTLSDAPKVLAELSEGRQWIFAVYAFTGGVLTHGMRRTLLGPDHVFSADCAKGLETIGAVRCAEALRRAMEAREPSDIWRDAYTEAFEAEDGRARMALYIREHPDQFADA